MRRDSDVGVENAGDFDVIHATAVGHPLNGVTAIRQAIEIVAVADGFRLRRRRIQRIERELLGFTVIVDGNLGDD